MTLTEPAAILFDWDSTLVDNWGTITLALDTTLVAMGQAPWGEAEVRRRTKSSARDAFPLLFGDRWEEALAIFYRTFEDSHLEALRPMPGAKALLDHLQDMDIPLGVVSNKTGSYLRTEVTHLGWGPFFGPVLGAGDAAFDKPAPDPIHQALRQMAIPEGSAIWYVGDSVVDMECAHRSGCQAILVGDLAAHPEGLEAWMPHARFKGCDSLLDAMTR